MPTVYLHPTGIGAADGTTPANAAKFMNGGDSDISDEVYNAYDGVNPMNIACIAGDYTLPIVIDMGTNLGGTPTVPVNFYAVAADGTPSVPPAGWTSDQPPWDSSAMARFSASINTQLFGGGVNINFRMFKFSSSAMTSGLSLFSVPGGCYFDFCQFLVGGSNTSVIGLAGGAMHLSNCSLQATGSYSSLVSLTSYNNNYFSNVRIEGNSTGTGNRDGIVGTSAATGTSMFDRVCIVNNGGVGAKLGGSANGIRVVFRDGVVANNGSDGVYVNIGATTPSFAHELVRMMVTGNGNYQLRINNSFNGVATYGSRFRGGVGNFTYTPHSDGGSSETAAGTDADEYVDAANGDFRIKRGSTLANRFGVSTQVVVVPRLG